MSADPVFAASVHDVRQIAVFLRAVDINDRATLTISQKELRVRVEEARLLEACAYIRSSIFDEYKYVPELRALPASQESGSQGIMIDIPLDTLLECLNIFGNAFPSSSVTSTEKRRKKWKQASDDEGDESRRVRGQRGTAKDNNTTLDQYFSDNNKKRTGMRMSYAGTGHPLKLFLVEDTAGPTTTCEIQTMQSEPPSEFPFDASRKILYIILQSSWLRDALLELDPSCDKLTFIGIPDTDSTNPEGRRNKIAKPTLRLCAELTIGSAQMDYPNDRGVLETFECAIPVKFTYHALHIKSTLQALQSSSKTCLRIDDEGLLSLQFMMAKSTVIEFKCLPIEDDTQAYN